MKLGRLWVFLLPLLLLLTGARQDLPWSEEKARFLQTLSSGDVDALLDQLSALQHYDNVEVAQLVVKYCLPHPDILVHREGFNNLIRLHDEDARHFVIDAATKNKSWEIRATCARAIASYGGDYVQSKLVELLGDKKWQVQSAAIQALGFMRQRESVPVLIEKLKTMSGRLHGDLQRSLIHITGERLPGRYQDWLNWWKLHEDTFKVPPEKDLPKLLGEERQKLRTAVREGLYGPIYSDKVIFLLDVSGSMTAGTELEGTRIEIAKKELQRVLENQLSPSTYFNIIAFSEEVIPYRKHLLRARTSNVERAAKFVGKLSAGGETNAYAALAAAFEDPDMDTIYLLSDGSPTVGKETIPQLIRRQVEEWNRTRWVTINCIGFFPGEAKNQDKAEARTFLRNLAADTGGFYKEIE